MSEDLRYSWRCRLRKLLALGVAPFAVVELPELPLRVQNERPRGGPLSALLRVRLVLRLGHYSMRDSALEDVNDL